MNTSTIYYVDSEVGDDAHPGTSPECPWLSLEAVNRTVLQPGDRLLLRAGGYWHGMLSPKGSGSEGRPIVIDRYGEGGRPIIDGAGLEGAVVCLFNQSYVEIRNLEITNDAAEEGDRRGVEVKAANIGMICHIVLHGLDIHHIRGIVGNHLTAKKTSGIYIAVTADDEVPTRFNRILIENCSLSHIANQGLVTNNEVAHNDYPGTEAWHRRKFTDLIVRGNTLSYITKNAMIIRLAEGGVIEHNVCFETATAITGNTMFSRSCDGTIFQYNEGFLNRSPDYDGSMYDPDYSSPRTVWQYSYSHDNAHGLIWFCTSPEDEGIVVRHNVSLNDRKNLIYFNYAFAGAYVYDNVFFIGKHCSPTIIREREGLRHTYYYNSNRIVNGSKSATYALSHDGKTTRHLSENVFRGHHPAGEPSNDPAGAPEAVLELWAAEEASCRQDAAWGSDMGAGQSPAARSSANVRCDLDDARPAEESPGITALLSTAPPKAGPVVEPVMTVNGHPVSAAEFSLLLQRHKGAVIRYFRDTYGIRYGSGFWTDSCAFCGESPLQLLKQRAAKEAIRRKLQQAALQQSGHNTPIDPLERRRQENECRSQLAAADRVVYGPLFFDEWSHYEYAFSLDCIEIRLQQEKHTEEAYQVWLEEAVEQADVQLLPGAWEGIQVQ